MNTYNHHLGDYAKDTKDLSLSEHGAYRLLLDYNYATEQPVPNDLAKLYRITGASTAAEKKAVEAVAEKFFPVNGDGRRHNKRADEELEKYRQRAEHNREVGKLGGRPRKNPEKTQADSQGETRLEPGENPNQEPKPKETKASPANAGEVRGEAANVPDCPHEKLIELYHELLPTCTRVVEWNPQRQALMRARWREKAVSKAKNWGYTTEEQGLACWRKFLAWCAQSDFLTGKAPGRDGGAPFVATLEWLIRPKNFVKVVEGNYHRR